ncbi:phosphotransferase [Pseudonocardia xishanensis]|uniref:Aminoglycoside phosphotransferase domain-containing protein n=1 Tax=Pseudonocardia xishanensis TaxID=630995 RepID=A0ABP8RSS2_9PSEU
MNSPAPVGAAHAVSSTEAMTPDWLTEVLHHSGLPAESAVVDLRTEKIGTGRIGEAHRLSPAYRGDRGTAPESLVATLPSTNPASLEFARAARLGAVEVDFYRDVAWPLCLWHGDNRLDTMLFRPGDEKDPLVVVDWQGIIPGPPVADVSHLLGNGLTTEDAEVHERDLPREYYHQALQAGGVEDCSWEDCLTTHRAQAFAGFVVTLISAVQVELTERGDAMTSTMLRGHADQVLRNDSFDALPA